MGIILMSFIVAMFTGVRHSAGFTFDEDAKRHYIYWDPKITEIIKDPNFSLQVEIGHFMDIVCPLDFEIADHPSSPPVLFDLYNVTEDGFRSCDPSGGRLIFACSLPDQENKLTIKFQTISPSPFGFRFQECAEYYFLAVKRPSAVAYGKGATKYQCTEESERLRIKVGCSHEKEEKQKTESSTTTTVSTITTRKTTSFYDRVKVEAGKERTNSVVVPDVKPIDQKPTQGSEKRPPQPTPQRYGGENGASRTAHFNVLTTLFCAILSLVCFFIQSTSS